ncbi:DUF6778 family protein [Yoonia litorea]|uniref:Lipoprotein n=1 Tax=Yoonia litorea TaxID=1123755 RepID=A0A1I6LYL1_9RHOB|nr:DUF6778 family protein [Yoonia litorea]SFS08523.1 hypothetical protein SAMN05444714_1028 [Yoonia litorea]
MLRRAFLATSILSLTAACGAGSVAQWTDPRPVMQRSYDLQGLRFAARQGIVVSEAGNFYPQADVVWRGDPLGPRIPQIEAIFEEAVRRNQSVLNGSTPVILEVGLIRFHGVTEATRATVGGVYNIIFELTVRHARTGEVIEGPRRVIGNLSAPGGSRGRSLDAAGQTEKVRVTDFLTGFLRQQLS